MIKVDYPKELQKSHWEKEDNGKTPALPAVVLQSFEKAEEAHTALVNKYISVINSEKTFEQTAIISMDKDKYICPCLSLSEDIIKSVSHIKSEHKDKIITMARVYQKRIRHFEEFVEKISEFFRKKKAYILSMLSSDCDLTEKLHKFFSRFNGGVDKTTFAVFIDELKKMISSVEHYYVLKENAYWKDEICKAFMNVKENYWISPFNFLQSAFVDVDNYITSFIDAVKLRGQIIEYDDAMDLIFLECAKKQRIFIELHSHLKLLESNIEACGCR